MNIPTWWQFLLLSLAAFRVWRLLAEDEVLAGPRNLLVGLPWGWEEIDEETRQHNPIPDNYRLGLAKFIACPWCFGGWISGGAALVWVYLEEWPGVVSFLIVWLSISAVVGVIAHFLSTDN